MASKVCATLGVARGGGASGAASTQDAGTGAILKLTHDGTGYRHVTMESVSEATYSGQIGIRFKTLESGNTTAPLERMRIAGNGNVGIGTTSPGKLLHVETPVNTSENLVRIASSMNNGSRSISGIEFVTNPQFYNADNGQRTPGCIKSGFYSDGVAGLIANWPDSYITLQTTITGALVDTLTCRGGNVGIGTTSPGHPLDVQFTGDSGIRSKNTGSSHASVFIDSASGYSYLRMESSGAAKFWLQSTPTGDLAFRPSGGGHVMDIKNNGNVGIGTSSPTSTLDVNGVLKVRGGLAYTNRPIAVVGRNAGKVSSPNVIITNVELYDPQNCHNTSNGRFTVPVGYAGYYLLMFNGIGGQYDVQPNTRWTVNGNDISWGAAHVNLGTGFTFTGQYARLLMSCQHIHYLSESDYVNIRMIGGSTYGTDTTHCSVCIMYMGSN
jgi:hypothetical protein